MRGREGKEDGERGWRETAREVGGSSGEASTGRPGREEEGRLENWKEKGDQQRRRRG